MITPDTENNFGGNFHYLYVWENSDNSKVIVEIATKIVKCTI